MSTSGIRFYDPKTTDMDLVQAMIHKGIVHDTFTDYVVKSENNDELAGKILAFIPSTEDLLAQIASCTHELDETDHASALEFTQELTKKCEEFGAPEMLKHCEVLKHKCIARDDVQSRESLVLLYEKYDILQHSLLRLLEIQNTPLHYNQVQTHAMERYQRSLEVISNHWFKKTILDARKAKKLGEQVADDAGPILGRTLSGGCGYGGEAVDDARR